MSLKTEATATVRRNGRVTLPIELRKTFGIKGGAKFAVTSDGKNLFLDFKNPEAGLTGEAIPRLTICVVD